MSTGAIRGFTADDALCLWANAWAAAVKTGDAASKAAATTVLLGASSWPAVTDLDTELEIRSVQEGDDSTRFGYLSLVGRPR